jgi:hypothetical protein
MVNDMTKYCFKDPHDTLDYAFDWKPLTHGRVGAKSDWLAEDESIAADIEPGEKIITITATDGITVESDGDYEIIESDGFITFWLSGGVSGQRYRISCKITTNAGRTKEMSMIIDCQNS